MTFAEKIKSLRKQAGMSQEKLAEKLNVSRQAITKWETGTGIPDIENIMAISALFHVSIDELLSNEKRGCRSSDFLYESMTEYDIDEQKHYDMNLGGARRLVISGYDGEKIQVRLASNTYTALQTDFKVKIDDIKKRIDVDVTRKNGATEAQAKDAVTMFVNLPNQYIGKVEAKINAAHVELLSLKCESIELDAKVQNVLVDGVIGTVEINCNLDMNLLCPSFNGAIEVNQISATSRLAVPEGTPFTAVSKGFGTSISYERGGRRVESFAAEEADNYIELNGIKSELVIYPLEEA